MTLLKELMDRLRSGKRDDLEQAFVGMGGALGVKIIRANGKIEEKGVVSRKVVTTAFVNYLVNCFLTSSTYPLDIFKYHECGTGTGAEATGDTTLGTAWATRATGTQGTAAGSANVFQSVATISFDSSRAITEHGVFNSSAAGTLLDRSSFAAINVASGDSIAFTYQLTCSAGN